MRNDPETIKEKYKLREHVEGGWFAEVYTSPSEFDGRHTMGSIYFLLDAGQVSHFHEIDCDEIWYYHEGYTFVSCVTTPQFEYSGFRLVDKEEIRSRFPDIADRIEHLAL